MLFSEVRPPTVSHQTLVIIHKLSPTFFHFILKTALLLSFGNSYLSGIAKIVEIYQSRKALHFSSIVVTLRGETARNAS